MASAIQSLAPKLNPALESYKRVLDVILSDVCQQAGATYGGLQRSLYPSMQPTVIFTSNVTHSTMMLPLSGISPMVIAAKVRESDLLFRGDSPTPALAPRRTYQLGCDVLKSLSQGSNDWGVIRTRVRKIRAGVSR
jgi:hypothetical protein